MAIKIFIDTRHKSFYTISVLYAKYKPSLNIGKYLLERIIENVGVIQIFTTLIFIIPFYIHALIFVDILCCYKVFPLKHIYIYKIWFYASVFDDASLKSFQGCTQSYEYSVTQV